MFKRGKKNPGKDAILPVCPPLPTMEEIATEIEKCNKDDYVFTSMENMKIHENEDFSNDFIDGEEIWFNTFSSLEEMNQDQETEFQFDNAQTFVELNQAIVKGKVNLDKHFQHLLESSEKCKEKISQLKNKIISELQIHSSEEKS